MINRRHNVQLTALTFFFLKSKNILRFTRKATTAGIDSDESAALHLCRIPNRTHQGEDGL